jgi:hypothetical protein
VQVLLVAPAGADAQTPQKLAKPAFEPSQVLSLLKYVPPFKDSHSLVLVGQAVQASVAPDPDL